MYMRAFEILLLRKGYKLKNITTMKPIFYQLITLLAFTACVETEFEVPEPNENEIVPEGTAVSIASVLSNLAQSSEPVISYRDTDAYITGYVTSSDVAGNFFRELI
ncbi:MAG: hypothetical protein COA80_10470, partial [Leeuwenhoekiella sp.]